MVRYVLFAIVIFFIISCSNGVDSSLVSSDGNHSLAYSNPYIHAHRKLLEFSVAQNTLRNDEKISIGPVEILGGGGLITCVYEPYTSYCGNLRTNKKATATSHTQQPLYVEISNMCNNEILLLLHYTYTVDSDSIYQVTDGVLYIPIKNSPTPQLNQFILENSPVQQTVTEKRRQIMLNVNDLLFL